MAFVFREPRNLSPKSFGCQRSQEIQSESEQREVEKSGSLRKGLACRRDENKVNETQKQFFLVRQDDSKYGKQEKSMRIHSNINSCVINMKAKNKAKDHSNKQAQKEVIISEKEQENQKQNKRQATNYAENRSKNSMNAKKQALKQSKTISEHQKHHLKKRNDENCKREQKKLPCLMNKQKGSMDSTFSLLHSKKKMNMVFSIPSIPGKEQKFGYVVNQNLLEYPKLVDKARFEGEKQSSPGPFDYQVHQNKRVKGVIKITKPKQSPPQKQQLHGLIDDQQSLKLHNQKLKEWINKANKKQFCKPKIVYEKRRQIIGQGESQSSDQQSLTSEYGLDTPGPGYYSILSSNIKQSFRSKNDKFTKIFYSQCKRFLSGKNDSKLSGNCMQAVFCTQTPSKAENKKNTNFFMSKLKRDTCMEISSSSPPPGVYEIRENLQNDIIMKILRSSPYVFNNKLPRLDETVHSITPGPGAYNLNFPNFKVESFKNQSHFMLKDQKNVDLKAFEGIVQQNASINHPIEAIHANPNKSIWCCEKSQVPFMSSSPRLLDLGTSIDSTQPARRYRQKQPKKKQNNHPFNSTEEKATKKQKYVPGVGLYDISKIKGLQKQSFNVLFN